MCADSDVVISCNGNRSPHHSGITGVKAAGDIGRAYQRYDVFI
jgi:hypothetical protein